MTSSPISLLEKLVAIKSYQEPHVVPETRMVNFLEKYISSNYSRYKIIKKPFAKSRNNLIVLGSSNPRIIVACHVDTVVPSSNSQLVLRSNGDKLSGLGAKDMKGGIVSTLLSMRQVKDPSKVGFLFYGDEEYKQKGMVQLCKYLPLLLKTTPKLIISPESRENLGTGARGIILLKLTIIGKKAHSARPHLGLDSVKAAFQLITKLEHTYSSETQLGITTFTITKFIGGGLSNTNRITDNPGSIPDIAKLTLSIRNAHVDLTGPKLIKHIEDYLKPLGFTVSAKIVSDFPARFTPTKVQTQLEKIISKATNTHIELSDPKLSGYNDAALLGTRLGCSVVNYGPYGEANHTPQEWVSLESITRVATGLAAIINHYVRP